MADTTANRSGIMTWVSTLQTTMANDPGRQLLEDQIQNSGFLFLEDYLESIMVRPRYNPIIELVKTPARRKNASNKARGATAKTMAIITMDLDDEDSDKENEVPASKSMSLNAFHKALLQSKDSNSAKSEERLNRDILESTNLTQSSKPTSSKKSSSSKAKAMSSLGVPLGDVLTDEEEDEEEKVIEKLVTPPHLRTLQLQHHELNPPAPIVSANRVDQPPVPPQHEPVTELSIIAEDDEPTERSQSSVAKSSPDVLAVANQSSVALSNKSADWSKLRAKKPLPKFDIMTVMDIDDITQTTNLTVTSSSAQSFQTVPPDSPASAPPHQLPISEGVASRPLPPKTRPSIPDARGYTTTPLPADETRADVAQQSQPIEMSLSKMPSVSEFPTIGPPSPLRKSMRVPREPLLAAVHVLPATKPANTRSSWLVKAREAKAMEDNAKKLTALPAASCTSTAGNKRKSGDMLGGERDGILEHDDAARTQKLTKITETSPVLSMLREQDKNPFALFRDEAIAVIDGEARERTSNAEDSDGMINKLKKTVAGFSVRAGKSMGKSLGGAAVTALAEARAAAEAKIAERNAVEGRVIPATAPHEPDSPRPPTPAPVPIATLESNQADTAQIHSSTNKDRRLSVSDLVTKYDSKSKEPERVFKPPPPTQPTTTVTATGNNNVSADMSTSTTPPNSPPKLRGTTFTLPEKPKLPTFFPPPSSQIFSRLEPGPFVPTHAPQSFAAHSMLFSTQSTFADPIFDHEIPPWVPSTQDTDFSDHAVPQNGIAKSHNHDVTEPETDMDADESWHLDEKFGETWTPVAIGMKDDSMTWTTAPMRSTRSGDTEAMDVSVHPPRLKSSATQEPPDGKDAVFEAIPSDNPPATTTDEIDEDDMDIELDEDVASVRLVTPAAQSNTGLSPSSKLRSQEDSQMLLNNTGGFFSSASKLVSSVLGGSKKGKEPVKSLQLAAAAAKKQREEAEKKVNRLREMETRRQQVLQKKADEDKAREEKKARGETERWKREREKEDTTDKRVLKQPGKKFEDDLAKKRKLVEAEKKTEPKKMPSKDKKDAFASKIGKFVPTSSQSGPNLSTVASKAARQATAGVIQTSTANAPNDAKPTLAGKGKERDKELDVKQPSQAVQSQMQARYVAQLDDSRKAEIPPTTAPAESIELPDINSDYSDSDDENRVRMFDPPDWAQSPELREALQFQSTVNPDDIFGAIRPLKMEELFKNRTSRFRARTSSANWAGTDELTVQEEREYARRMGYRK